MARKFIIDGREFPDIDPKLTTEEVRQHYANFFSELSNASTSESRSGDDIIYTFQKRTGTKG